eukprot:3801918-Pyramimonas_sp.AAC.1
MYDKSVQSVVWLLDKPRKRILSGKQSLEGTRKGDGPSTAASSCGTAHGSARGLLAVPTTVAETSDGETLEKRKKITGKTSPRPNGSPDGDKDAGLTDGVKFLQARSELISNVRKLGEELTGERGMKVTLKALSDDLKKKGTDLNLLPYAPDKIMQEIDEVNGHVQALLKKVSNIQKHEVAESEKSLSDLTSSISIIKDKHVDLKSAGDHLIAEARNNERSNRQKDYWVQTKVNAALTKNGFGKQHAKRLSKIIFNFEAADLTKIHVHPTTSEDSAHGITINRDEDTLDFNHVSVWAAGNAWANNFKKILNEDARVQAKLTTMKAA